MSNGEETYDEFAWYKRLLQNREKSAITVICPDCLKPIPVIEVEAEFEPHPDNCHCGQYITINDLTKAHGLEIYTSLFVQVNTLDQFAEIA